MKTLSIKSLRKLMPARQSRLPFSSKHWLILLLLASFQVTAIAADQDGDGIVDIEDNCITVANPAQRDSNGDGYGNRCDADLDNNQIVDVADFFIFLNRFKSQDPDADLNGDGRVNRADFFLLRNLIFNPPGPSCCEIQIVSSGKLRITLKKTGDGVGVSSITNGSVEISNSNAQNEVFSLLVKNTTNELSGSITSSANWGSTDVTLSNKGADSTLTFSNPTQNGLPSTLVATVTIKTIGSKSEWDLSVTGLGNNHSLINVNFPNINIKAEGEDQFLIPRYSGQLIFNPGTAINYDGRYPWGSLSTMQFLAYYNADYGIYFGFHDPSAAFKSFRVSNESKGVKMEGGFSIPDMTIAGNDWEMPGHFELDLFSGDWYEAAQIYKSWVSASANYWPKSTPEREARQANIGKISVWTNFGEFAFQADQIQSSMQKFIDYFPGITVGIHFYQWNHHRQDDSFPNYFPEKVGVAELINNIQSNNDAFIMPYINGRLWDDELKGEFNFKNEGLASATKKIEKGDDGKIYWTQSFENRAANKEFISAVMCPTETPWQNIMTNTSDQITDRMGAAGVYLDQVASASTVECMDINHGHFLGGGSLWRDGYSEMFKKIHTAIPAGKFVTVEGGSDYLTDQVDGFLTDRWIDPNLVPAFPAVYSGKVQLFGTSTGGSAFIFNHASFYSKLAQSFSHGIQPGRFFYPLVDPQGPGAAKAAPFVKRIATMRYKLRDFMSFGEMQKRIPLTGNIPDITSTWKVNPTVPVTISAIQSSIWKSKDGRVAVVLVNASMTDDLDFSFTFDASQYGLKGGLHIKEVTETSEVALSATYSGITPKKALLPTYTGFTENVSLPALQVKAYIISQ